MKLKHLIIAALGAACLLASCGKEPNNTTPVEEKPSVTVSPTSLSFSNSAGSQDITLTTNCNWTAESDVAWAGPSITSGGASRSGAVVKISVKDNKGVEARNATITFTGKNDSGTVTAKLTVSQEAYDVPEILELSSATMTMSAKGESKTFTFKATRDWIAGVYAEEDSWIGCPIMGYGSEKSQSITISALENKGGERTGKVTFKMGNLSADLTVIQLSAIQPETLTIAQFNEKAPDTGDWYRITGTITQICDNSAKAYGNFYIKDDTGELFVYGLTKEFSQGSNDQSFSKLGLKEGDVLTFVTQRSEYHGEPQGGGNSQPAFYESHVPGTTPSKVYHDYKADKADQTWLELPATSSEDDNLFLHHTMYIGSQEVRNYSMYWDHHNMVARWVAYPLYRKAIGYGTRSDKWGLDPLLSRSEQPVLERTYSSSDGNTYDRGHQIPSADRLSYASNVTTFYWTNMTPQLNELNGALWGDLENKVRIWSKRSETDTLYVVTGCVVDGSETFVTDNDGKQVTVPTHYYKALLRVYQGNYNAIGFYLEHRKYDNNKVDKSIAVSIDELEALTGEDFFVNLPDGIEASVEAKDPKTDSWWWDNMGD